MRVYIAAPLGQARLAVQVSHAVMGSGHVVVSSWHHRVVDTGATSDPVQPHDRAACLAANLLELDLADAVVVLAHRGVPRATYAEAGYALASGERIVWVHSSEGQGRCIFDAHRLVVRTAVPPRAHIETVWAAVLDGLAEVQRRDAAAELRDLLGAP